MIRSPHTMSFMMSRLYSVSSGAVPSHVIKMIKIDNPTKRNALSYKVMKDVVDQLKQIKEVSNNSERKNEIPKVVVLYSEGPVFCSGHDLKELRANDTKFHSESFQLCNDLMESIRTLDQPVIAQVQGLATAAGCQIVGACDLAVCSSNAQFATPGVKIGLFCTTPGISISRSLSRKKALEMLFTGTPISAQEALQHGLVNKVVQPEELEDVVRQMATNIAQASLETLRIGKRSFYAQVDMNIDDAYKFGCQVMTNNMSEEDCKEGIDAFIQKRSPNFKN
ncbi:Echdc3 [Acrasis kona]|uniref:Enoyl-CoA hydratase domain-containing protein 3, mitochondrial n=1 Tax=Acrasis kona TaxID=1008807 RepID=A0AAW2ZLC1_9EUKA